MAFAMSEQTQPISLTRILLLTLGATVVLGGALALFLLGNPPATARVALRSFDGPSTAEVQLPPGAEVGFSAYADDASFVHARDEALDLRIELLNGDSVVLDKSCCAIGGAHVKTGGSQKGITFWSDECDLKTPASGANKIRITPKWRQGGAGVKVRGLAILVFVDAE